MCRRLLCFLVCDKMLVCGVAITFGVSDCSVYQPLAIFTCTLKNLILHVVH